MPGYQDTNTFLKALGIIFLALLTLKFAPVLLAPVFILLVTTLVLGVVLTAGATVTVLVSLAVITALAPICLPVALVVGFVMLICRLVRGPAVTA